MVGGYFLSVMATKDRYNIQRKMDKWLGSAILLFLGLIFLKKRPVPDSIRSIAVTKTDGIGDLVLITAVVSDLRAAFPNAEIILVCGPFNYPLASLLSSFDRIVCLSISNPFRAIIKLRQLRPDVCIDLGNWPRIDALIAFASGSRWTVGLKTKGQYRHFAHDMVFPYHRDQHELANYKSLLRPLGIETSHPPILELKDDGIISRSAEEVINQKPYAILHLWSGSAKWSKLKEWPFDRWRNVAERLNQRGRRVYLTGCKQDWERSEKFVSECVWSGSRVHNIAYLNMRDLIEVLRNASIVVSIDTSITHMGAALGTPVLALHGPSSSRQWGPIGPKVEVIDSPLQGCGFMNWGADATCKQAKLKCMEAIRVETVLERIETMLGKGA